MPRTTPQALHWQLGCQPPNNDLFFRGAFGAFAVSNILATIFQGGQVPLDVPATIRSASTSDVSAAGVVTCIFHALILVISFSLILDSSLLKWHRGARAITGQREWTSASLWTLFFGVAVGILVGTFFPFYWVWDLQGVYRLLDVALLALGLIVLANSVRNWNSVIEQYELTPANTVVAEIAGTLGHVECRFSGDASRQALIFQQTHGEYTLLDPSSVFDLCNGKVRIVWLDPLLSLFNGSIYTDDRGRFNQQSPPAPTVANTPRTTAESKLFRVSAQLLLTLRIPDSRPRPLFSADAVDCFVTFFDAQDFGKNKIVDAIQRSLTNLSAPYSRARSDMRKSIRLAEESPATFLAQRDTPYISPYSRSSPFIVFSELRRLDIEREAAQCAMALIQAASDGYLSADILLSLDKTGDDGTEETGNKQFDTYFLANLKGAMSANVADPVIAQVSKQLDILLSYADLRVLLTSPEYRQEEGDRAFWQDQAARWKLIAQRCVQDFKDHYARAVERSNKVLESLETFQPYMEWIVGFDSEERSSMGGALLAASLQPDLLARCDILDATLPEFAPRRAQRKGPEQLTQRKSS